MSLETLAGSSALSLIERRFQSLFMLLWERSFITSEPVVLTELACECGLSESDARTAWREFRDRDWIETFRLPGAARIKPTGRAVAATMDAARGRHTSCGRGESYLPALPDRLHAPLQGVWRASVSRRRAVDAPNFVDDHRDWTSALEELEQQRLIGRDADVYRMTTLGLFILDDPEARALLLLACRLRGVLRLHFRNEASRPQPISYSALSSELGLDRGQLTFALTHLTDALIVWCDGYTPTFDEPNGHLHPREGVLDDSIFDVARALAGFALKYAPHPLARPQSMPLAGFTDAPSARMTTTTALPASGPPVPVVMISYSHDSQAHKDWVRALAERLTKDGIKVVLDQWDLALGDALPRFMEESITSAGYVLLVCTETYVEKADARAGGVGYESSILSAQLLAAKQIAVKEPARIIPIVRQSTANVQLPRFAAGRYYANLSENASDPDGAYEELVRTLHGTPKHQPPALGANPFRLPDGEPAPNEPSRTSQPASRTVGSSSSREVSRALTAAREAGAGALLARQSKIPRLPHSTPEGRGDELNLVLQTHEPYLRELVRATMGGQLPVRRLAQEIEDVITIAAWPQAGYVHMVQLPRVLGWAAHRLVGTGLLLDGHASLAVDLARESVLWGDHPRKLIDVPELIGWPSVPGNSREAWEHTRSWPQRFPWLKDLFGEQEYWIGMNAHFMALNFAEFLERALHGPGFDQIRQDREHGPRVPLYFWAEPPSVARRAFRLVAEDARPGLRERVGPAIHLSLGELWERWLAFQREWLVIESGSAAPSKPPHEDLLPAVLAPRS